MSTPTGPNDPDRHDPDHPATPNDPTTSNDPATSKDPTPEPPRYGDRSPYGQPAPQYGEAPPPQYGQEQYGQEQYGQDTPRHGDEPRYTQETPRMAGSYGSGGTGYTTPSGYERQQSNGLGIAALVFGILALLFSWIPYVNIVSMILGIIGIVVGILALRKVKRGEATNRGMSLTGLALSAVALVLSLVITIAVTAFIGQNIGELADCTNPNLSQEEQQACIEELGNN